MHVGILEPAMSGKHWAEVSSRFGHDVKLGARGARNRKALPWAREMGAKASAGIFADAASFGEVVILATLGLANESALELAGLEKFRGKIVIDTTNPLDFSAGIPSRLSPSVAWLHAIGLNSAE